MEPRVRRYLVSSALGDLGQMMRYTRTVYLLLLGRPLRTHLLDSCRPIESIPESKAARYSGNEAEYLKDLKDLKDVGDSGPPLSASASFIKSV